MKKILFIINLMLDEIVYLISIVRFYNIWRFKKYLYDKKNEKFLLKRNYVHSFDKRLQKYSSWIGYDSEIKGIPIFPHGISGLFISGGGYNWL